MLKFAKGVLCFFRGHKTHIGTACPVTGIRVITCEKCGKNNMPKHKDSMSFN